jgi:hypothetical protein
VNPSDSSWLNGLAAGGAFYYLKPASEETAPAAPTVPAVPLGSVHPSDSSWFNGLAAGGAFYYLKPYVNNNTAFVTTVAPGGPLSEVNSTSFHWDYKSAGAFWLGWSTPSGLGARARYFFFDQEATPAFVYNTTTAAPQTTVNLPSGFLPLSTGGTAFGSPGTVLNSGLGNDVLTFQSNLQISAVDAEATYAWQGPRWQVLVSGGGRYLNLTQDYRAILTNTPPDLPVSELQVFSANRKFTGAGPVAGVQGNFRIGQSGLSVFGTARGSLLVGTLSETVLFSQTVSDPTGVIPPNIPGTLAISPSGTRTADHVLSVGEVEVGLQYELNLRGSRMFFRGAAVNQTYFDAGSPSQSNGNLSLFGVQLSLGLNY